MEQALEKKNKFLKILFISFIELFLGYLFVFVFLPGQLAIQENNLSQSFAPIIEQTQSLDKLRNKVAAKGDLIHYNRMTKKLNADKLFLKKAKYNKTLQQLRINYMLKAKFYISVIFVVMVLTISTLLL